MCNNLHNFGLFQRHPGVMDKRLFFNLRNGKRAACNHEVMGALAKHERSRPRATLAS